VEARQVNALLRVITKAHDGVGHHIGHHHGHGGGGAAAGKLHHRGGVAQRPRAATAERFRHQHVEKTERAELAQRFERKALFFVPAAGVGCELFFREIARGF